MEKMEAYTSLQYQDIIIHEYHVSTNKGNIMWARMDQVTVDIILKQSSKLPARTFKAIPFIPEIARQRKKEIDSIMLEYKRRVNDNLRYVVKNNDDDLKLLIRNYNKYEHLPYREVELDILGKLPDFNCVTKKDTIPENVASAAEDPEGFEVTREEKKRKKKKKKS